MASEPSCLYFKLKNSAVFIYFIFLGLITAQHRHICGSHFRAASVAGAGETRCTPTLKEPGGKTLSVFVVLSVLVWLCVAAYANAHLLVSFHG